MRILVAASLLATAACAPDEIVGGDAYAEVVALPALPNSKLDLLFVIDDSPSMMEEQDQLRAKFPLMMDVLSELEGGLPDLHVAVTTSDLGLATRDGAPPLTMPGCDLADGGAFHVGTGGLVDGTFIIDGEDGSGNRVRNYDGELRDAFQQIASVGGNGCGFEQHLGAMESALDHPGNAGFLRDDANLAIIILADEDDCTAQSQLLYGPDSETYGRQDDFRCTRFGLVCDESFDTEGVKTNCVPAEDSPLVAGVQPFIDSLLARKPDERMIMISAIVGDPSEVAVELRPQPSGLPVTALARACTYEGEPSGQNPTGTQTANPAVRIAAFLDAFPGRSQLASICSPDLTGPLVAIGDTAKKLMGDPCIDTSNLADSSPDAGIQPTCEVLDEDASTARAVPACAGASGTDCYELVADAAQCPRSADHLKLALRRSSTVASSIWTRMRCLAR